MPEGADPDVADQTDGPDRKGARSHDVEVRIDEPFEHRIDRAFNLVSPDREHGRRPAELGEVLREEARTMRAGGVGRRKLRRDEHHAPPVHTGLGAEAHATTAVVTAG